MVNFCYDIITFWMCDFNLVLTRCFFNEKHKKINYRKRVEMVKILAKESKCTSMVRQPHQRGM